MERLFNYDNFQLAPNINAQAEASLIRPNPKLQNAIDNSAVKGLPPISVSAVSGQYLTILARLMGAKSVLEVGTLGGYSSICFAEGGAKVTSIEIDPKHAEVARENTQGLEVEVLLGSAEDVMPRLAEEGRQFDIVFIDADFDNQLDHFDWAVKLTRVGGCVFLDDVIATMIKNGHTERDSDSIVTKIGMDERVTATLSTTAHCHPMVPSALLNGYLIAHVNHH